MNNKCENMKNIIDVYEASLLGDIEDTFDYGDKLSVDMFKLQWEYTYLNNLPNRNQNAIVGGMEEIYRKYFKKNVPELFTDCYSTLETLINKYDRKHKINKLDIDGNYIASYILQCELNKFVNRYDFKNSKSDRLYLSERITKHMSKILNDNGKKAITFKVREKFKGSSKPIISIAMISNNIADFKTGMPRYCDEIMCFNFTKGQYYYK